MTSTYIRHRARMVQESVFEDLSNTLIACRWKVGTTSRLVYPSEGDLTQTPGYVTTTPEDVFALAEGYPVNLIDYFPQAEGEMAGATPPNTFAMDNGRPGEAALLELGSNSMEQPYRFNFAFYAVSDAVADAVMSDLKDRYEGRLVNHDFIALYDYNSAPADIAVQMEIDSFRFSRDVETATPADVHLFFGELALTDLLFE